MADSSPPAAASARPTPRATAQAEALATAERQLYGAAGPPSRPRATPVTLPEGEEFCFPSHSSPQLTAPLGLEVPLPESQEAPDSARPETVVSLEDDWSTDPERVPPSAPAVLAGFLVNYDAPLGRYWPLHQGINWLGRDPLRVVPTASDAPNATIVRLDHDTVSSHHARIYASARPGRMKLEDTHSRNGTWLGSQRVEPGQRVELRDGALLTLGELRLIVKLI